MLALLAPYQLQTYRCVKVSRRGGGPRCQGLYVIELSIAVMNCYHHLAGHAVERVLA
jgi:hypothetical protein